MKLHFYLNLSEIWSHLWNSVYSFLITFSMNLFDQLVIINCDPVMEG